MSLDIYLYANTDSQPTHHQGIIFFDGMGLKELTQQEWEQRFPDKEPTLSTIYADTSQCVFHANITHNLATMARYAGLYRALWRPEELQAVKAGNLIKILEFGLTALKERPQHYKNYNPPNGWGSYEALVEVVQNYLLACKAYRSAKIVVSR